MNNNYSNQTPPNGNNSDYYRWNGSDNNGNKKSPWRIVLAVFIIVALALVILGGATMLGNIYEGTSSGDASDNAESLSESHSSVAEESSRPDYSVPDFVISDNDDHSSELTAIYEKCSPSCCTIRVTYAKNSGYAIGSGFVIDSENGYIATNHHVIEDADKITVIFYNGEEYEAELIGSDSVTDLAVICIDAEGLVQIELGDSSNVKVGETVVAIGTPYDETLAGTMTCGIVSGIARNVEVTNDYGNVVKTMTLLQTDCTINPGNSGGPLINSTGKVIGINSLKIVEESFENVGFAIPITEACDIFTKLIAGEDIGDTELAVATAQIGIQITTPEKGFASYRIKPTCDYPEEGVFVYRFTTYSSSAYRAGLAVSDIITEFNGEAVKSNEDLGNLLSQCRAGQEVTVKVFRFNRNFSAGEYIEITFKLDAVS